MIYLLLPPLLFLALEIWVRIVIDPWMKESDPDNDGVRKRL